MDPLRLVVRTAFAYVFLLALIRISGKRAIKHGDAGSFVVALIIGDMFDDVVWAEVPVSQFVVAVSAIVSVHLLVTASLFRAGGGRAAAQ
jgi:uncharacterized membrane protein YcaP (DUF421 family)